MTKNFNVHELALTDVCYEINDSALNAVSLNMAEIAFNSYFNKWRKRERLIDPIAEARIRAYQTSTPNA